MIISFSYGFNRLVSKIFTIIHDANSDVTGLAQCIQCNGRIKFNKKSRTNCKDHAMIHKAEWNEFEEEKAKSVAFKNNQRRLFPLGGQLALTSGLLPRNHEENTKLRKLLAHSIGCSVAPANIIQSPVVVNLVNPRLSLPSNNTIQRDIICLLMNSF